MRKHTTVSVALVILSLAPAAVRAQVPASSIVPFAEGARALGMGGAFTGVADDMYSPFWNPAGAAQLRGTHLVAFDAQARLSGPLTVNDLTSNFPTSTSAQIALAERISGGTSTLNVSSDFAIGRDGVIISIAPLAIGTLVSNAFSNPNNPGGLPNAGSTAQFAGTVGGEAVATYGRSLNHSDMVGLNFKVLSLQTVTSTATYGAIAGGQQVITTTSTTPQQMTTSFAADFGYMHRYSKYGQWGATWQNFVGPDNQGVNPQRLSLGVSDRPFGYHLLLAAAFDNLGGAGVGRLNLGAEGSWGKFAVRAGLYHGQPTGGIGFGQFFNIAIGSGGTLAGIHIGF